MISGDCYVRYLGEKLEFEVIFDTDMTMANYERGKKNIFSV